MRILLLILFLTSCREVTVTWEMQAHREDGSYLPPEEVAYCEIWYGDSFADINTAKFYCYNDSVELLIPDGDTFFIIRAVDTEGLESRWSDIIVI